MSLTSWIVQLSLLIGALVGVFFLSAWEMAFLTANRIHVRQRAKAGEPAARRAFRLLQRGEQLLTMFLIGQNVCSVLAAVVATRLMHQWLVGWKAALVATVGLTVLIVVVTEMTPKAIGQRRGEGMLLARSWLLDALHHLFMPLTGLIHYYIRVLLRLMGRERAPFVTREDLKLLVRFAESRDEAHRLEKHMLESILEFRETVAREIMIPLGRAVTLPRGTPVAAWLAAVQRHGHTRIPVYEGREDRIVGLANIFDLLYDEQPKPTIDDYLRPVPIVPDSKLIDQLLVELQKTRNPMAVIVDEFGSCRGIVTVEDMVEEIVGELEDEHEPRERKIYKIASRVFVVDALTDVDDINQELDVNLPKGRYDTIGGLVLKRAGRIPRVGESFTLHGLSVEVLEAGPYGVRTLRLTLPDEPRIA
jgi:CBS domain containing-hemolysin-like protein